MALIFLETSSTIYSKSTLLKAPTIAATVAPINKINWFDPPRESSPYIKTLYANIKINAITGITAARIPKLGLLCCSDSYISLINIKLIVMLQF